MNEPHKFPWGKVIKDHEFGDYTIREYEQWNVIQFHAYHNGSDLNESWPTLEMAIIGAIAKVHDGCNSQASLYFFRMIGLTNDFPSHPIEKEL